MSKKADGRLNADNLLPDEVGRGPQDACGVFAIWTPPQDETKDQTQNIEVAKLTYFGLYALQHRGQESAGIATSNGSNIMIYKDMGLVSQVFDEPALASLVGHLAIGHTRYSTTGGVTWENAQPTLGDTVFGTVALAHNGNLVNSVELAHIVKKRYGQSQNGEVARGNTTDTALITALLQGNSAHSSDTLFETAQEIFPLLRGAFSLVFMDEKSIYAARDPQGVRPLVIGKTPNIEGGYVVASENAALDIIGAKFLREVDPGELIRIDENGIKSVRFAEENRAGCVFEYVYLARPDAVIKGKSVHQARADMGKTLAKEHPAPAADLVIPVPESGTPAAIGFAHGSHIPFAHGLTKNSYVGRTFIQPSDALRQVGIRLKLNPLRDVIEGKNLVVVDDSIVRGNTQKKLVQMLRESGAAQVHVRISSPPVMWPCFYGIDFATRNELIANNMTIDEMCAEIGADSLGFLSLEGMIEATDRPVESFCTACFTGNYPIELPESDQRGKFSLG